jgi:hypothetical protein
MFYIGGGSGKPSCNPRRATYLVTFRVLEHDVGNFDWENVRSELLERVSGSESDFNTMKQQRSSSLTAEPTTEDAIGEVSDDRYCASD